MPLDPNDVAARLDSKQDACWWGVAEQLGDMSFRVTRHADYNRAFALTETADNIHVWILGSCLDETKLRPHIVAPGTPGARRASTSPMVASVDHGTVWVFCASGWAVPEVVR